MVDDTRQRWLALYILCLGSLMIVLDATIVNVALPSIREDLGFSETSLAWVVNAYLLTFGGFLLLGGRLGDLFGHRRLFLVGITLFTVASLGCGLAGSQEFLVGARAVQGLGGALVSAVALSLIMTLFTEPAERAKAMGVFGFVLSGGGTAGVLLGGVLTDALDWLWIFLVNLPIGVAVYLLSLRLLPAARVTAASGRLDIAGAVTVTASLMPAGLFRNRNVSAANAVGVLMAAGMFAYFFFSALYLQQVLGYTPLEVGLAYLPSTVIWGTSSLLVSDRLVMRFGVKMPLLTGLGLMTAGLVLFARTPVDGNFLVDVLAGTIAIGIGAGIAFNPLLLAAMSDVAPEESGLASGVVNTAFMMGGAVGLAILASLAASGSDRLRESGDGPLAALNGGYHVAFLVGAVFVVASAVSALFLRAGLDQSAQEGEVVRARAAAEVD